MVAFHVMRSALWAAYGFFGLGLLMLIFHLSAHWSQTTLLTGVVFLLASPVARLAILVWRWTKQGQTRVLAIPAVVTLLLYSANIAIKIWSSKSPW